MGMAPYGNKCACFPTYCGVSVHLARCLNGVLNVNFLPGEGPKGPLCDCENIAD